MSVPEFYRGQKATDGYAHFYRNLTWRERLWALLTGKVNWCYKRATPVPYHDLAVSAGGQGGDYGMVSYRDPDQCTQIEFYDTYDEALVRFNELKLELDHYAGIAGRAEVGS